MKKLLTALAMTAVIASPALAQTVHHRAPAPMSQSDRWEDSYAQVPATIESDSVFTEGKYRGTDPDPQIRLDLRRESPRGGAG